MLDIREHKCHFGKIANNLETHGDKEHVTGFTTPITDFSLTPEQFEAFFDRKYASRAVLDTKGQKATPALDFIEPYKVKNDFENATVNLVVTGNRKLEFKGSKIKDIYFWPNEHGEIELEFRLYVRPGIGKDNLVLQENQETDIRLSIQDAKIATKAKDKQQDLFASGNGAETGSTKTANGKAAPLRNGEQIDPALNARNPNAPKMGDGTSKEDLEKFKAGATAKVRAHQQRNPNTKRNTREAGKRSRPGAH